MCVFTHTTQHDKQKHTRVTRVSRDRELRYTHRGRHMTAGPSEKRTDWAAIGTWHMGDLTVRAGPPAASRLGTSA